MALIPPFFSDCVLAIGFDDKEGKRAWAASGFLYGDFLRQDGDTQWHQVYLITNRHVFLERQKAYLRCNPQADEPAREYELSLVDRDGKPLWLTHADPDVDIAVIPVNMPKLREEGMQVSYFHSDQHVANVEKLNELGITEGDFTYVLGFPMGLVGGNRNFVIARSGSIARIRDTLAKTNKEFLIDTFIFPGNSGGPVVSKPEAMAITGTKSQNAAFLIGVVKGYVPYRDIAISPQTGQPRVVFEENSGLATAHPVDYIQDIIHAIPMAAAEEPEKVSTKDQ